MNGSAMPSTAVSPSGAAASRGVRARTALLLTAAGATAAMALLPAVNTAMHIGDFPAHIRNAQALLESQVWIPQFGYHLFVIALHLVMPWTGWDTAAFLVTLGGVAVTAAILASWLQAAVDDRPAFYVLVVTLPVALLILQPVLGFGPLARDQWLIGYFPPNQWHSPTTLFSKPLALVLFAAGAAALNRRGADPRAIAFCALMSVMSVIIKPNFLMAFLPVIVLAGVVRWRSGDVRMIAGGFVAPAVLVLAAQYLGRYAFAQAGEESVAWSPLYVIGLFSPVDAATLTWKLLASILFPLAVTVCFPSALRDVRLPLAWGLAISGTAFGYLLAEGGRTADHGNFLWSGQLAMFVLFAVATAVLVSRITAPAAGSRTTLWLRAAVCSTLLAWHVVSGIRHFESSWL